MKKIISYIEEFYKEYKENDVEEIYINSEMYYIGKPDIEKWNSIPEIEKMLRSAMCEDQKMNNLLKSMYSVREEYEYGAHNEVGMDRS